MSGFRLYAPALVLLAGAGALAIAESVMVTAGVLIALGWSLVAHLSEQRRRPR